MLRYTERTKAKISWRLVQKWPLTWNQFFRCIITYWGINVVSKCLPAHCVMIVHRWLNLNTFCYDSKFNLNADLSNRFHARAWPIETNHEIPGLIFLMIIRHKKMNKTTTVKTCCYILILHLWSQQTGLGPPMLSSPSEGIEHTFHEKCWIIGQKWHF